MRNVCICKLQDGEWKVVGICCCNMCNYHLVYMVGKKAKRSSNWKVKFNSLHSLSKYLIRYYPNMDT